MTRKEIEEYLLSMPGAWIDHPFGEDVTVYKVGHKDADEEEHMFALISENETPLRVSLKCDPQLAELLRERYETVVPGYHLSKKHWNTIICTGQVPDDEIQDFIRHSHHLVTDQHTT